MAKSTISKDTVTLVFLQKYVAKVLGESELNLIKPKMSLERRIEFLDGMLATLSAGVLADHLEHKQATYTIVELPRWLKWLERFTIKHTRLLKLDAYHTYPKANIKLPELGRPQIDIIKADYEI